MNEKISEARIEAYKRYGVWNAIVSMFKAFRDKRRFWTSSDKLWDLFVEIKDDINIDWDKLHQTDLNPHGFDFYFPFDFEIDKALKEWMKSSNYKVDSSDYFHKGYMGNAVQRSYSVRLDDTYSDISIYLKSGIEGSTCKVNVLRDEKQAEDAIWEIVCPKALEEPIFE